MEQGLVSTPTILLAQEAAFRIEDVGYEHITLPQWAMIYNRVQRDISLRRKIIEHQDTTALVEDERYPYPDGMVQLNGVEFTETPDSPGTYRFLGEIFENEWRALTTGSYPIGMPESYLARKSMFVLDKVPAAVIDKAIRITYWATPEDVADIQIGTLELPDFARDHVVDGMVIMAMYARGDERRAAAAEREWLKREEFIAEPISDRSEDRRSNLRTQSSINPYGDQV